MQKFCPLHAILYTYIGCIVGIEYSLSSVACTSMVGLGVNMYSADIRWRVIYLRFSNPRHSIQSISEMLFISSRTVRRILRKFMEQRNVSCEKVGRRSRSTLHAHEQLTLMEEVLRNPSATLVEILNEIVLTTGSRYDLSTISRTLRRFGLTRKRVSIKWNFCCCC